MAGLVRKTSIPFGFQGPTSSFGQFGSKEAGFPQTSQDPAVIQQLSAWSQGWQNAVVTSDKAAYIEDMNGFCFVDSWQITYILQMGLSEWDNGTLYFTGSWVQTASNGQLFRSLQGGVPGAGAGQSGNAPPVSASNAFWQWMNPPEFVSTGAPTVNTIPKVTATALGIGPVGSVALQNSAISDNGINVIISEPLQFPDASIQNSAASPLSNTSNNIAGSRSLTQNPPYHNALPRPLFVTVGVTLGAGGDILAYSGNQSSFAGLTTNTYLVGELGNGNNTSVFATISFWVLAGQYYVLTSGGPASLVAWTEWS